jgi:hypothetical protein
MRLITFVLSGALGLSTLPAAPVTFSGGGTLTLRPDPGNPTLTFEANTFNNLLIFIIADRSNAAMKITGIFDPVLKSLDKNPTALVDLPLELSDGNGCKGTTLNPGDVCAFDVLFDTSGVNDGASNQWRISEQVSVKYLTQPFAIPATVPAVNPLRVTVTVQNPAETSFPGEVPEPGTFALAAPVLAIGWAGRRYLARLRYD